MITGNAAWLAALQQEQKQALWAFIIPGYSITVLNFIPAGLQPLVITPPIIVPPPPPTLRVGYGVELYGVDGYGT